MNLNNCKTINDRAAVNADLLAALEKAEPGAWLLATSGNKDASDTYQQILAAIRKAKGE